jgi:tRNA A-37 threonylcarbamoyl transferase component Bud32
LTYVDCGFVTLACAVEPDTPSSTKQKWVDQVTGILAQLHKAGIVWGDAKPYNVLIDKNDDAWIIDFGGGYTRGFVETEKAGTIQGDFQGLEKIVEYVLRREQSRILSLSSVCYCSQQTILNALIHS